MITLINLTNHPSSKWSERQKQGWDNIIDIPFPNIHASASEQDLTNTVTEYAERIGKIASEIEGNEFYICFQGEFTFFCFMLYDVLRNNFEEDKWHICIPTTERRVIETFKQDGTVEKIAIFGFVRWPII